MTYNVRYFAHAARLKGLHSSARGLRLIADAIARLPELPHVVCLQEVETRSLRSGPSHSRGLPGETQLEAFMGALDAALERAARSERYGGFYFPAHSYRMGPAKLYTTGLAILVREDLEVDNDHGHSPHDITHRRFKLTAKLKQSRVCAHVRVLDHGGTLYDIFNTHLSLPAFFARSTWSGPGRMGWGENQLAEVDALAAFVERRAVSDRFVLVGDFNALPGSAVYVRIQHRLSVHDAFARALETPPEVLRVRWPTCGFLHYRMRLDHVFTGPGLRGSSFAGSHRFGDRDGHFHGLSDHVPIIGVLEPDLPPVLSDPSVRQTP